MIQTIAIANILKAVVKSSRNPHFDTGHFVFGNNGSVAIQSKRHGTDIVRVTLPHDFLDDLYVYMDCNRWESTWDYKKTVAPYAHTLVITNIKSPESQRWVTQTEIEITRRYDGIIISCNLNEVTKCDGSFNKGLFGLFDVFVPEKEIRKNAKKIFQYSVMEKLHHENSKITQFTNTPAVNE